MSCSGPTFASVGLALYRRNLTLQPPCHDYHRRNTRATARWSLVFVTLSRRVVTIVAIVPTTRVGDFLARTRRDDATRIGSTGRPMRIIAIALVASIIVGPAPMAFAQSPTPAAQEA